ncbi:MAG: agmatinase [Actinomycetota bacterium]
MSRFIEAAGGPATPDVDAIIMGFAIDGNVSFRPGAGAAPNGIRAFSEEIETWSPRAHRDLTDLKIVDVGDATGWDAIEETVAAVLADAWTGTERPLLVSMGGDHSVTPPIVRAVSPRCDGLAVIGFDAHLDLRHEYPGEHACTYRRLVDRGHESYVFGLRSGERSEWEDAPHVLAYHSSILDVEVAMDRIGTRRPVYVTLDIDVIRSGEAPGTGTPEAGGPSFDEVLEALEKLEALDVVAFDIVEVAPPFDPSGITQAAAAILIREAILRFA